MLLGQRMRGLALHSGAKRLPGVKKSRVTWATWAYQSSLDFESTHPKIIKNGMGYPQNLVADTYLSLLWYHWYPIYYGSEVAYWNTSTRVTEISFDSPSLYACFQIAKKL